MHPIGILGGTFDPIHFGHLRTAVELFQDLNLAEVRLIPCYSPVHKNLTFTSAEHRLKMVQLAIQDEPYLKADDSEILRQGPSYMIDTLEALHQKVPNAPLCLILGIDALLGFPTWHRSQDILKLAHIVVAHRPGYQLPNTGVVANLLKNHLTDDFKALHNTQAGQILLHPVTLLEISATEIREQVRMGKSPRYLLPDAVYEYIKHHGIYEKSGI